MNIINEIQPTEWKLQNRIGYNEMIYNSFRPEFYNTLKKPKCDCDDGVCEEKVENNINLYPQQRLIRDYIQFNSPYRGVLLYHELGSGKSGASIAAAEGYINKKKIFVLSPASLAVNYENEILKISSVGLNLKKSWTQIKINKSNKKSLEILFDKYSISPTIIKKDGIIWVPLYENDIPASIIIKNKIDDEDKLLVSITTSNIIKNRYTFISYNGLSKKLIESLGETPFDNSFVIIDEAHNFISRVVNGSILARSIYSHLMNAKNMKIILLSGTPMINNPYEIATLINLIRGYMQVYVLSYSKTSKIITKDELIKNKEFGMIDEYYIDNENRRILISLLPIGFKKNDKGNIIKSDWEDDIDGYIKKIINSINDNVGVKINSKYSINNYNALPTNKDDFNKFFLDVSDDDDPKVQNEDLFMRRVLGTVSYYSISGSDLFPSVLPEIKKELYMTDNQYLDYKKARNYEIKQDLNKKKGKGLFAENSSVYRAFTRAVCNFSFPENIKRVYPKDIKKIRKMMLDDDSDNESEDGIKGGVGKKRKDEMDVNDEYLKEMNSMMDKLIKSDALDLDNLRKFYSPKFAEIVKDVNESPGSVLIYSSFRTVEGLGILSEVLNRQGFKQVQIKKIDNEYYFTDDDIFDKKYDNKRYVIFDQDREKTRFLMSLFNNDFSNISNEMRKKLPNYNQLYGKLIKIFCITQSGAEGISLKNVRRVLLVEPFWNNVRIEQVVGRAIRSCSHEALPKEDRTVQVFSYIMKLTDIQKTEDFNIERNDKGLTTDEHILMTAEKKKFIITKFLNMLKGASFDCIINSKQNKPLLNNFHCYSWALGADKNDYSYTSDINNDNRIMKHRNFQIKKKNKGRVIMSKGNKYIKMNDKIYNYYSYINAGILIEDKII